MPDRTWAPEVVEKFARQLDPDYWAWWDTWANRTDSRNNKARLARLANASAKLDNSQLPAALDLIERAVAVLDCVNNGWADVPDVLVECADLQADAAAFVARVGEGK